MRKINVLVLTSGFPNASDSNSLSIFVKQQLVALRERLGNVTVIAPYPYNSSLTEKLSHFPPSKNFTDYKYKNISVYYPKYIDLPFGIFENIRPQRWAKIISKIIDEHDIKFDLIHAHFTYPAGAAAALLSKRYDKPYIISAHENQTWLKKNLTGPKAQWSRSIWQGANTVIRVNMADTAILKKQYPNIIHIPNGIDTHVFKPVNKSKARHKLKLPQKHKIILCVGNFFPVKNQALLVRALAKLKDQNYHCYLIGHGPDYSDLKNLINDLGLRNNVTIVGFQKNALLPYWYSAADVLCVPSKKESFGIVQLEAMACGTPVVSNHNGSSEKIITSTSGVLSKTQTPKAYSEAIEACLAKHWKQEVVRRNAKSYSWQAIIPKIISLYASVTKNAVRK